MSDKELSITTEGVVLKGDIVDDVRAPIRRVASTADSVLRLASNVLTIPLDYTSTFLERFRQRYADRFEEIPLANRQEPPTRIACAVMQHVAYSTDEPDIQDLFANLLATASNSETVHHVHPGYATVINELRAADAVVLRALADQKGRALHFVQSRMADTLSQEVFDEAISNLVRLGLVDWKMMRYATTDLKAFAPKGYGIVRADQTDKLLIDLANEVQRLKQELTKQLAVQHQRVELEITSFGRNFLAAVSEPRRADTDSLSGEG